jgi:hypothetical protein
MALVVKSFNLALEPDPVRFQFIVSSGTGRPECRGGAQKAQARNRPEQHRLQDVLIPSAIVLLTPSPTRQAEPSQGKARDQIRDQGNGSAAVEQEWRRGHPQPERHVQEPN